MVHTRSTSDNMAQLMVYTDPNMLTFRIVRKLSNNRALVVKVFNRPTSNLKPGSTKIWNDKDVTSERPISDLKVGSVKIWNTKDFTLERTIDSWRTKVVLGYMSSLSPSLSQSMYREFERGLELLYGVDPTTHNFNEGV